jgi:hypothetical protein
MAATNDGNDNGSIELGMKVSGRRIDHNRAFRTFR